MEALILTLFNPSLAISRLEPWKRPFYPLTVLWLAVFCGLSIGFDGGKHRLLLISLGGAFFGFTLLVAYCGAVHVYFSSTGHSGDVSRLLYGMSIALFPVIALPIAWDFFVLLGQTGTLVLRGAVFLACARTVLAAATVTYSVGGFEAMKALLFPPVLMSALAGSALFVLGLV